MCRQSFLRTLVVVLAVQACFTGCVAQRDQAEPPTSLQRFSHIKIILEHNQKDGDGEVVVFAKGRKTGLVSFRVVGPTGKVVLEVKGRKGATLGYREFALETAEPSLDAAKKAFPEGAYRFEGKTIKGARLQGKADLTHALLSAPKVRVDTKAGVVHWDAVPGATGYEIELEKEVPGGEMIKLIVSPLPSSVTSWQLDPVYRKPGDYQVGVGVRSSSGNLTVQEREFSIRR